MDFRHRGAFPKENYWRATDPKRAVVTDGAAPAEREARAVILRGYIAGKHSQRSPPRVCMYVCMYVCIFIFLYLLIYVCIYMYAFLYVCMHVCMCVCVCVCVCNNVCVYAYIPGT